MRIAAMFSLRSVAFVLAVTLASAAYADEAQDHLAAARDITGADAQISLPAQAPVYLKLRRAAGAGFSWKGVASSTAVSVVDLGGARPPAPDIAAKPIVGFPLFDVFRVSRSSPGAVEVLFTLSRASGELAATRKALLVD